MAAVKALRQRLCSARLPSGGALTQASGLAHREFGSNSTGRPGRILSGQTRPAYAVLRQVPDRMPDTPRCLQILLRSPVGLRQSAAGGQPGTAQTLAEGFYRCMAEE